MKKLLTFLCLLIPCNAFCATPDLPNGVSWIDDSDLLSYLGRTYSCNDVDGEAVLRNDDILFLLIQDEPLVVLRCVKGLVNDKFVDDLMGRSHICEESDLQFSNPNELISTDEYTVSIKQTKLSGFRHPPKTNTGVFINGCVLVKCNEGYRPDYKNNQCVERTAPEDEATNIREIVDGINFKDLNGENPFNKE